MTDASWTTQVRATESDFYRVFGAAESIVDYEAPASPSHLQKHGSTRGRLWKVRLPLVRFCFLLFS